MFASLFRRRAVRRPTTPIGRRTRLEVEWLEPRWLLSTDTTVTLTSDHSPGNTSVYGEPVKFTATIDPVGGSGTPTGHVDFFDGSTNISGDVPVTLGANQSTATFTTNKLTVNGGSAHSITAQYTDPAGNFTGHTSSAVTDTVSQGTTSTTVQTSKSPTVFGEPVTFTATVSPIAPSTLAPTGHVDFFEGATNLSGDVPLTPGSGGSSTAAFTINSLDVAHSPHTITAAYTDPAGNYVDQNTGNTTTQTVTTAPTTTKVSSSANPSMFGQPVTFTITVSASPGTIPPTGSVTISIDGTPVTNPSNNTTSFTLQGGQATYTTTALALSPPDHTVTATYTSDNTTNFSSSTTTAPIFMQRVDPAATLTTLVSSQNPAVPGQAVTLTATVSGVAPGSIPPLGSVTFFEDGTPLAAATLVGGVATITSPALTGGLHLFTAAYSGFVQNNATEWLPSSGTFVQVAGFVVPALVIALDPASLKAGKDATLDVFGFGFTPGSVVLLNGQVLPTIFINGVLQARVSRKLLGHHHNKVTFTLIVFVPGVGVSLPVAVTVRPDLSK
jgi:hypothetical protein